VGNTKLPFTVEYSLYAEYTAKGVVSEVVAPHIDDDILKSLGISGLAILFTVEDIKRRLPAEQTFTILDELLDGYYNNISKDSKVSVEKSAESLLTTVANHSTVAKEIARRLSSN